MKMLLRRILTVIGLMMIGEGLVVMVAPTRYMAIWRGGPKVFREAVDWFAENPEPTRAIGAVEFVAGLLLALRETTD